LPGTGTSDSATKPLWKVILVSWGIAFFEYCFQVPANRIGADRFSPVQLKVIQESDHAGGLRRLRHLLFRGASALEPRGLAAIFLVGAVFFAFHTW
jgi:uncharacterized protein